MSYSFDENTVSDLHKDAFGFRPSQNWWADWSSMNDEGKQQEWDSLLVSLERSMVQDKADEAVAVEKFAALVAKTIASGAKNVETAHRWIMEASDCNGDWDYLCWSHGLPYTYFGKHSALYA